MATLKATIRRDEDKGKKGSKRIRSNGQVPATIYGCKLDPISIALDPVSYLKALNASEFKKNLLLNLEVENGATERVITKDVLVNPINNQCIHIDFYRVADDSAIQVKVPITVQGISAGQRLGGVLVKQKTTVTLQCFPNDIPKNISVDVTALGIGDIIRAEDLIVADGQQLISNPKDIMIKVESTKVSKAAASQDSNDPASAAAE